jgi:DNA-binding transcriptional ArsR family regulator
MSAAIAGPAGVPPSELEPAAPPEPERLISDPETLRALADPLRLRILETMVTRAAEPWSVKELAAALRVPQTRLYHHIDILLERDLIRAAARRLVSGIVETRYQVAALSLRLDPHLLQGDDEAASTAALVTNILEEVRGEILAAVRAAVGEPGSLAPDRPIFNRGLTRLTPERAGELRARLLALFDEFDDGELEGAKPYSFLVAFHAASIGVRPDD